ncbi:hypothetical protein HanRHA438_Chr02g0047361 [Helianthus annuus]|nr:hypothetical protein HanRHA438_Chr02g0047361 [Helianthus annuus]
MEPHEINHGIAACNPQYLDQSFLSSRIPFLASGFLTLSNTFSSSILLVPPKSGRTQRFRLLFVPGGSTMIVPHR